MTPLTSIIQRSDRPILSKEHGDHPVKAVTVRDVSILKVRFLEVEEMVKGNYLSCREDSGSSPSTYMEVHSYLYFQF